MVEKGVGEALDWGGGGSNLVVMVTGGLRNLCEMCSHSKGTLFT